MVDDFIETGVDKLVKLVSKEQKLTIEQAARTLGVSLTVIQEWADFLEEEGIISIEYKLTKTYLVERKLTKKDIESKAKDFTGKKEIFIRKVEGAIQSIESDTSGLDKIKKDFGDLQEMVSSKIDKIKEKLVQLEKYENLKKNIDQQILGQHSEFKDKMGVLDKEIQNARGVYDGIINEIEREQTQLKEENTKANALLEQENKLTEKITLIEQIIKKLHTQIEEEDDSIEESKTRILKLQKVAEKVTGEVRKKQDKLKDLITESKEKEKQIFKMQEEVISELKEKEDIIKKDVINTEDVTKRFENFFKKKNEINAIMDKVLIDRENLKRELNSIAKSALAFELSSKQGSSKQQIAEIEKKFKELDKKRDFFRKEIEKLKQLIIS